MRTRKKANGEGSIIKKARKSGGYSYEARIGGEIEPDSGKLKTITKTFKTNKEAQEWLDNMKLQRRSGVKLSADKVILAEWVKTWLYDYSKAVVRKTTWDSYESVYRVHVRDHKIGQIPLKDLRPEHLQKFYNEKAKAISSRTVKYIHNVISQALRRGVKNGLLMRNVADAKLVDIPRIEKHEIKPLSPEQLKQFIRSIEGHRYQVPLLIECYTGLRRGELLGLKWADFDFAKKNLTVNRNLVNTNDGLMFNEPKTKASRRSIPLPEELVAILSNGIGSNKTRRDCKWGKRMRITTCCFVARWAGRLTRVVLLSSFRRC